MNTSKITNTMKQFTKEENPLDKNFICIYEQRATKKHLFFQVDKRNFENDKEFNDAVGFILDSLNKNI